MAAPTVISIEPATGPAGTFVTITGTGFTEDISEVSFGGVSAGTRYAFISDTQLVAYVPSGSGTVAVSVTNPAGTGTGGSFLYVASGVGDPPSLDTISPATAGHGEVVSLFGTGLGSVYLVRFGLTDADPVAAFGVVSDTQLDVLVPKGSGDVQVYVESPFGSDSIAFDYAVTDPPVVTSVSPSGGFRLAPVIIEGSAFLTATHVSFGGEQADYMMASDTVIYAYVPASATGLVHVTVGNLIGDSAESAADLFDVIVAGSPVPVNLSASPLGVDAVLVKWDAVVSESPLTYRLYRSPDGSTWTHLADTTANILSVAQPATDGARYYAVASVDVAGTESSKSASAGPVTANALTLPDGSLTITKFASGIVPPRVVTSLPTLPDAAYPAGSVVFLTTDGRLYSTVNGAAGTWANVVSADNLTGQLDADQIAAGAVTAEALADGVISGSKFAPGIKTLVTADALPDLPDPDYPPGTVIFVPSEGRLYRVQEAVDIVPIMVSNTAPAGVASASSEYSAAYAAWKAFSKVAGDYWANHASDTAPWTLGYQFATPKVITWYSLKPAPIGVEPLDEAPKDWTFEGFNGSGWVVLDTRTGVTWTADTAQAFDVANETAYSSYRLNISANGGSSGYCVVSSFQMAGWMESTPTFITSADIASDAAIPESKLALDYPTHSNALDHAKQHSITSGADHTFPGGTTDFLRADGAFAPPAAAGIPSGVIVMWSGSIASIPAGWYLCDGTNGTPDLRDRFIVGAGGSYAKGATGGEATHALATGELPIHAHAIDHDHGSVTSGGHSVDHTHGGTTGNENTGHLHSGTTGGMNASNPHGHTISQHRHSPTVPVLRSTAAGSTSSTGRWGTGASRELTTGEYVADWGGNDANATNIDHGHGFTTGDIDRVHQHGFTTGGASANHTHAVDLPNHTGSSGNAGSGTAHENRPPYLALAYIMKG